MKFVFTPISVITGLLAGLLGKKIFELWAWSTMRSHFAGATGSWPGEEAPQSD